MKGFNRTHVAAFGVGVTLALFGAAVFAAEGGSAYRADGFPATAFEYARMVEPELGIPPRIDLGEGAETPFKAAFNQPGREALDQPAVGSFKEKFREAPRGGKTFNKPKRKAPSHP